MRWVVYVLADPRTGDIRYVGGSNNPQRRLKEHLYDCAVPENSKRQWIQELKRLNMLPLVVEIMDCDSEKQLSEEEIHWTRRLRLAGCDLVNHSRRRYSNSAEWMAKRTLKWRKSMEDSKKQRAKWAKQRKKLKTKWIKVVSYVPQS